MGLKEAIVLLFTHGAPILFFVYMATDLLLRNKKKAEHILLSLVAVFYLLLFAEEYIRNQVSIDYSPLLSAIWFGSVGLVIPSLCFHFLFEITRMHEKMSRHLYPWVFYLPLIFVVLNLATGGQLISAQQFTESGMWKFPVYNAGYYIAMTAGIVLQVLYFVPLLIAKSRSANEEQRSVYRQLMIGIAVGLAGHIALGYFDYGGNLPPYPYIYNGLLWCYFLRRTMRRYDFLNSYHTRFEKLFNLNPDVIMLLNREGRVKNANPGAQRYFASLHLEADRFFHLLDAEVKQRIQAQNEISSFETGIIVGSRRLTLLLHADYLWAENDWHILLIVRDITVQKQQREEIHFLAYHDSLTRLPNRRYFHAKLEAALLEAGRKGDTVALLLLDLDKLKWLNDTQGHLIGDEALQTAARIIREEAARVRGVAARMGGDEFVLFITDSPSAEEVVATIGRLQAGYARYAARFGPDACVGISIGAGYYPADGMEVQALIHAADSAMFEMKRSRGGNLR